MLTVGSAEDVTGQLVLTDGADLTNTVIDLYGELALSATSDVSTVEVILHQDSNLILGSGGIERDQYASLTTGYGGLDYLSLDGRLTLELENGFTPVSGNTFDLLDWGDQW